MQILFFINLDWDSNDREEDLMKYRTELPESWIAQGLKERGITSSEQVPESAIKMIDFPAIPRVGEDIQPWMDAELVPVVYVAHYLYLGYSQVHLRISFHDFMGQFLVPNDDPADDWIFLPKEESFATVQSAVQKWLVR